MFSAMTPKIGEIRPIIFKSLPMIIATAILLILISTFVFSRKIVNPIEKLVNHAVFMKDNTSREVELMKIEGQDEIAVLGETLNDLYLKLNENFKELEKKNDYLSEQNKRQEVFLRASSHQLKTPVAAALLLVEGMINEIGKYKDTKDHLPKVKLQLQSMRKIIDDILDYTGDEKLLGKSIKGDLKEGVYTLPLIYALQQDQNGELRDLIYKDDIDDNDIQRILDLTKEFDGIEKSRNLANLYTKRALNLFNKLPDCQAKEMYLDIIDVMLKRNY